MASLHALRRRGRCARGTFGSDRLHWNRKRRVDHMMANAARAVIDQTQPDDEYVTTRRSSAPRGDCRAAAHTRCPQRVQKAWSGASRLPQAMQNWRRDEAGGGAA